MLFTKIIVQINQFTGYMRESTMDRQLDRPDTDAISIARHPRESSLCYKYLGKIQNVKNSAEKVPFQRKSKHNRMECTEIYRMKFVIEIDILKWSSDLTNPDLASPLSSKSQQCPPSSPNLRLCLDAIGFSFGSVNLWESRFQSDAGQSGGYHMHENADIV